MGWITLNNKNNIQPVVIDSSMEICGSDVTFSNRELSIVAALREQGLVPLMERLGIPFEQGLTDLIPDLQVCSVFSDQQLSLVRLKPFKPDIALLDSPGKLGVSKNRIGSLRDAKKTGPKFGRFEHGQFRDISRAKQGTRGVYAIAAPLLMVSDTLGRLDHVLSR